MWKYFVGLSCWDLNKTSSLDLYLFLSLFVGIQPGSGGNMDVGLSGKYLVWSSLTLSLFWIILGRFTALILFGIGCFCCVCVFSIAYAPTLNHTIPFKIIEFDRHKETDRLQVLLLLLFVDALGWWPAWVIKPKCKYLATWKLDSKY